METERQTKESRKFIVHTIMGYELLFLTTPNSYNKA